MANKQRRTLRTGLNPLAYMGVEPVAPINFVTNARDPGNNDNKGFYIGDEWENRTTKDVFKLLSLAAGVATWSKFAGLVGMQTRLRDDAATIIAPDANNIITVSGGNNIYTDSAANTLIVNLDDRTALDGQLLTGVTGGTAVWANLVAGAGIIITDAPGSITIAAGGGGAVVTFTADVGNAATVAGTINVFGGLNINTQGDLADTFTINLDTSIVLPNTNAAGTEGLYTLGTTEFLSNYNGNAFLGGAGNRTTTGSANTLVGLLSGAVLTSASNNCSLGDAALGGVTSGNFNIAIGDTSGAAITTESSNIYLNNSGTIGDSHILRIGDSVIPDNTLTAAYIDGIYQETVDETTREVVVADGVDKFGSMTLDNLKVYVKIGYITKVVCNGSTTLVLTSEGAVYGAGRNTYGQLGNGTATDTTYFTRMLLDGASGVTDIALGRNHSVISKSGTLYACGLNDYGQLGNGTTTNSLFLTAMTGFGTSGVTSIAAGSSYTAILKSGVGYACGDNAYGQLGDGTTVSKLVLTAMNGHGTAGCTAISAKAGHTVVLKTDVGYACGYNAFGQLGDNTIINKSTLTAMVAPGNAGCTAIATGIGHTVVLKTNAVYACGNNTYGQLGDNTGVDRHLLTAMVAPGAAGVTAIAAGGYHTAVLKTAVAYACGRNVEGGLGDGTLVNRLLLTAMNGEGTSEVTAIAAGGFHDGAAHDNGAVIKDGIVFSTGDNAHGQLADMTLVDKSTLTRMVV